MANPGGDNQGTTGQQPANQPDPIRMNALQMASLPTLAYMRTWVPPRSLAMLSTAERARLPTRPLHFRPGDD